MKYYFFRDALASPKSPKWPKWRSGAFIWFLIWLKIALFSIIFEPEKKRKSMLRAVEQTTCKYTRRISQYVLCLTEVRLIFANIYLYVPLRGGNKYKKFFCCDLYIRNSGLLLNHLSRRDKLWNRCYFWPNFNTVLLDHQLFLTYQNIEMSLSLHTLCYSVPENYLVLAL